jgi:hypothetical protein
MGRGIITHVFILIAYLFTKYLLLCLLGTGSRTPALFVKRLWSEKEEKRTQTMAIRKHILAEVNLGKVRV